MPFKDPEEKRKYNKAFVEKYKTERRDDYLRSLRNASLIKRYGITLEDYKNISEKQNHVCAICGNVETATIKGQIKNLAVDHCHQSGEVRGLLCADCNRALGMFKDNIQTLENAINYLKGD